MNEAKRKNYFAQTRLLGDGHRAKHFLPLEEAAAWLRANGGGTIKKRGTLHDPVCGPMRNCWLEVAEINV